MPSIVECVPNFSNGRDPDVYNRIADAIRGVKGAQVLDISADPDHNRTVITFVGGPAEVEEAAFQAIATAAPLINLDHHQGEHPRIGATDVCPFVPVRGISLAECADIARRLGKRVGEELGIAVYLYGAAAARPERETLAAIRKGEYELWKQEVATNPDRAPDFGPAEPKPWGATVIGARPFLIAYNIYLNSDNPEIAERISRAVRFSNGGLRFLQAKGFQVEGQAQVSMNLTNFEKTPLHRVQEMVQREARQYGLSITHSELVGLIPQKALLDSARWYLQLKDMQDDQVLENNLTAPAASEPPSAASGPESFIEAVAAATPTPGGGSVAALAGALGAALAKMVAGLTVGRKRYAAVGEQAQRVLDEAEALRDRLTRAIAEDAAAFEALMSASRNKELDEAQRTEAITAATLQAATVPLQVARLGRDVARLAQTITAIGNVNAATDAAAGAIMARAAVEIAALNVRINGVGLADQTMVAGWGRELDALTEETVKLAAAASATAAERGGF